MRNPLLKTLLIIGSALMNVALVYPPVQKFIARQIETTDYWKIQIALFAIFCLIVGWVVYSLIKENQELKSVKPEITVVPTQDASKLYLMVLNSGENGIFKAEIGVVYCSFHDPSIELTKYMAVWHSSLKSSLEIMQGQTESIFIGTICKTSKGKKLTLHGYNEQDNKIWDFIPNTLDVDIDYRLQVTISSKPSQKTGIPYVKNYDVNIHDGIKESRIQPDFNRKVYITKREYELVKDNQVKRKAK